MVQMTTRDPSGLAVIEALAPQVSRYAKEMGSGVYCAYAPLANHELEEQLSGEHYFPPSVTVTRTMTREEARAKYPGIQC